MREVHLGVEVNRRDAILEHGLVDSIDLIEAVEHFLRDVLCACDEHFVGILDASSGEFAQSLLFNERRYDEQPFGLCEDIIEECCVGVLRLTKPRREELVSIFHERSVHFEAFDAEDVIGHLEHLLSLFTGGLFGEVKQEGVEGLVLGGEFATFANREQFAAHGDDDIDIVAIGEIAAEDEQTDLFIAVVVSLTDDPHLRVEVSGHVVGVHDLLDATLKEGVNGLTVLRDLDAAFVTEQDKAVTATTDGFEQVGR